MKKLMIGAVCAMMAAATFAEPKVEITKAYQAEPGSGIVNYTYTISGLKGVTDLYIKVGAEGCSTTRTLTFTNVKEGTVTAEVDVKELLGQAYPNVTLFAELEDGVQLWENGPYFAKANIGATEPEGSGYYFWWGGTTGYKWDGSKWVSVTDSSKTTTFDYNDTTSNPSYNKNISTLKSTGWINFHSGNLDPVYDAATAKIGGPWRMPTNDEMGNLLTNCDVVWTTDWNNTGIKGLIVTGKGSYSGNSIFLPAAGRGYAGRYINSNSSGYYWSSTPESATYDGAKAARYLYFGESNCFMNYESRYDGLPVRAVR